MPTVKKYTMSFEFCVGSTPDQDFGTVEEAATAVLDWATGQITSDLGRESREGRAWCKNRDEVVAVLESGGEVSVDITVHGCRESVARVRPVGE